MSSIWDVPKGISKPGFVFFLTVVIGASVLFAGWVVMLLTGILYGAGIIPATLGFGESILVGVLIRLMLARNPSKVSTS